MTGSSIVIVVVGDERNVRPASSELLCRILMVRIRQFQCPIRLSNGCERLLHDIGTAAGIIVIMMTISVGRLLFFVRLFFFPFEESKETFGLLFGGICVN